MIKKTAYLTALLIGAGSLCSCDGDWATPPADMPEQVGNGTGATPYNVGAALVQIYSEQYTNRNVYVAGTVSHIDSFEPSYGNMTYYISDDGSRSNELEIYRGLGLNGQRFTAADQLNVGDKVVVYCQLTYYNNSVAETNQGAIIVSLNGSAYEAAEPVDPAGQGTFEDPYNVTKTLDVIFSPEIPTQKVYVKGKISQIDDLSTSFGNATYYISDSGTTLDQLEVYRGYGLGGAKFSSASDIKVGDEVIVYGQVVLFNSTPEFTTGSIIVSLNGKVDMGSGSNTPDTPDTPAGDVIYTGLSADDNGWTIDNGTLPEGLSYVWKWDANYKNMKASAYVNNTNHATSAVVYRAFDLSAYKTAAAAFEHAYKYCAAPKNALFFVVREQGTTEWKTAEIPAWPTGNDWTFVPSGSIDLSAWAGKKIELGFKYTSTASEAATWEVKNFTLSASK